MSESRVRYLAIPLSIAGVLTAWAMTIDAKFHRQHGRIDPKRAAAVFDGRIEDVSISAHDGVALRGWVLTPKRLNGRSVLLVHGGGLNREYMLGRAKWFLREGYSCLLVDSRGCGESGGVMSYGVHEPGDAAAWSRWLRRRAGKGRVFAYGSSRGATTLVQSLAWLPPLDGIVAESAGVGMISRPYEFVGEQTGMSAKAANVVFWPLIEPSFAWVRLRRGIDLRDAQSGLEAVKSSRTPVLIVQGAADDVTPLRGAERLREAGAGHVELVVIPRVGHDWFGHGQPVVMQRILAWFESLSSS